jgi:hypothetical protein
VFYPRTNIHAVSTGGDRLNLKKAEFELVPYLRFRKALTIGDAALEPGSRLSDARIANERTVIVIAAAELAKFLESWRIPQRTDRKLPWVALQERLASEHRDGWVRAQLSAAELRDGDPEE